MVRKLTGGLRLRSGLVSRHRPLVDELHGRGLSGQWHIWTVGSRTVRVTLELTHAESGDVVSSSTLFVRHRDFRSGRAFERLLRRAVKL